MKNQTLREVSAIVIGFLFIAIVVIAAIKIGS
jgi:hypothetical protein